jgi:hypothetical protein
MHTRPKRHLPVRLRLGPPSRVAELDISVIDLILARLMQGPAVRIDRPPSPAAPKSDHHRDRPCHSEVAGQTRSLRMWSGQPQGTPRENLTQTSKFGGSS